MTSVRKELTWWDKWINDETKFPLTLREREKKTWNDSMKVFGKTGEKISYCINLCYDRTNEGFGEWIICYEEHKKWFEIAKIGREIVKKLTYEYYRDK